MSTTLYLHCITHQPHIGSGEIGSHLGYLDKIREDIVMRDELVKLWNDSEKLGGFEPDLGDSYRTNTARFFVQHPLCALAIFDEYGVEYPIAEPPEEEDPALIVLQYVANARLPVMTDNVAVSIPVHVIKSARRALKKRDEQ